MHGTAVGAASNLRHRSRVILLTDRDEVGRFLTLERGQEQEQEEEQGRLRRSE